MNICNRIRKFRQTVLVLSELTKGCFGSLRAYKFTAFIALELTDGQFSYTSVTSAALNVELHRLTPEISPTVMYLSSKSLQSSVGVPSPAKRIDQP